MQCSDRVLFVSLVDLDGGVNLADKPEARQEANRTAQNEENEAHGEVGGEVQENRDAIDELKIA